MRLSRMLIVALVLGLLLPVILFAGKLASHTLAQTTGDIVLFSDNFEDGDAAGWTLRGTGGGSGAGLWEVEKEQDGNWVLSGREHNWGTLSSQSKWSDFTFKARVKIMPGSTQGLHLNYRLGVTGTRYFIAFHPGNIYLARSMPPDTHTRLADVPERHEVGQWYSVEIVGKENHLQVYVDSNLRIDFVDTTPVLSGGIGIEALDGSHVHVDDILVTGPPLPPPPAWASEFSWAFTGGPRGGIGYDVRIKPTDYSTLWVTDAYAGAHQSTDGGLTWKSMNSGITARTGYSGDAIPIFSLTIDPNNPEILWAGTQGMRGVFKSDDGGKNWEETDRGVEERPGTEVRSFTVEPGNSNVAYMGGNYRPDPRKLEERGFIYKTVDGGKQWTKILEPGALVRWIIVDPIDTRVLYASTGIFDRIAVKPEGILKSVDGGVTWSNINDGLTSLSVGGLAMHPNNSQFLFATTGKASAFLNEERELYGAVFKTTDGGQHWRKVYPRGRDFQIRYSAVASAPSNPNIVYVDAGHEFLRSTDGGETWTRFDVSHRTMAGEWRGQPIALAVHPENPDLVYMNAYDGGVFRSEDGGRSWVDASAGYSGLRTWDIMVDPKNAGHVVVGSKSGVYASSDGARTWLGRNTDGNINNILSVALDPNAPEKILAGSEIAGWVRMSTDGGDTWQTILPPLGVDTPTGRISIYQIVFAPSQPSTVYAATGIAELTLGLDRKIPGRGVYKSSDGGRSWSAVNNGLEAARLNILSLAVSSRNANLVYAGTLDNGVFKSEDGGLSWSQKSSGIPVGEIRSIVVDPRDYNVVYAGTENSALYKSLDGGSNWKSSSAGIDPEASIRSIVTDPSRPEVVYAADRRTGVYRSADAGKTWVRISQGLRMRAVNRLAISTDGKVFYAATEGGGVFRMGQPPVASPAPSPSPTATPTPPPSPAATAPVPVAPSPVSTPAPSPPPPTPSLSATRPSTSAAPSAVAEASAGTPVPAVAAPPEDTEERSGLWLIVSATALFVVVAAGFGLHSKYRKGRN